MRRLLTIDELAPSWLLLGEFSGAWAERAECERGVITLSVDRRAPERPGLAYVGDFHDILPLRVWAMLCAWPSCTHQAQSNDRESRLAKALDGRTFWGIVGVLYCLFAGDAHARMIEQPDTVIPYYCRALSLTPAVRLRTTHFGDLVGKTLCLYLVNANLDGLEAYRRVALGTPIPRAPIWTFANAEERDRHRSSWNHFPLCILALALCLTIEVEAAPVTTFAAAVERFAVAWHKDGWPVPEDYESPTGQPTSEDDRAYQLERGPGDRRRPPAVTPRSLLSPAGDTAVTTIEAEPFEVRQLSSAQMVEIAALTTRGLMLFFLSMAWQPLVFAELTGMRVLGAELPIRLTPKTTAMHLMERWAALAWGAAAPATTFMIGRYLDGPRVGVALLPFVPPVRDVIRTPRERIAAYARGVRYGWLTLAALAGCALADPAARAFAAVGACARPVSGMADLLFASEADRPVFTFGSMRAASMVPSPRLMLARTPTELCLAADASNAMLLRDTILKRLGPGAEHLDGWCERIQPPPVDLHEDLAAILPDYADAKLLTFPFSKLYQAPSTKALPRAPPQPSRAPPFCVKSPVQLLGESGRRRLHAWLEKALDQLLCIERGQERCELLRPHPLVIGQSALKDWARGVVWDFTFERAPCATPLDFTLPVESGLDLDYLRKRLTDYPDRRLLSFLLEGMRFEADVELHTVLVPHLISLPLGFESVRKELYRLEDNGWYKFFDHLPFWPIYLNGQGATARKLEVRYRRTTECGGPRKDTYDESGLRALSINEATMTQHFPRHFHDRLNEPLFRAWLEAKDLLEEAGREVPSVHPHEFKPTLTQVMNDLAILLAASRLLDEPIYVFGDDAKDYFNQLAIASEDWWKLGVVFLAPEAPGDLPAPGRNRIFFVSERRLGFGAKLSSNAAQRFSEALLFLLREDMDALEAQQPLDMRPSAQQWREARSKISSRLSDQSRLYFVHMYTDDPIFGVVGVERALRLLKVWHTLTRKVRLLMAIPEKRNLGTWAPWLGVLLCAGLGLVIVPKAKLLRTSQRIGLLLAGRPLFDEYRSLMGMLEFLRCVNCAPGSVMYGLYGPHRSARVRNGGPTTPVLLTAFMVAQLERWLVLITQTGGAPFTAALRRQVHPLSLTYVVSSDAATDSDPPGIGGFCHGLYWFLALKAEWLQWLHITVLELLATGGSALAFCSYLRASANVLLQSDGLATPYVLSRHRSRSPILSLAHHALLRLEAFTEVAQKARIAHLDGDSNVFGDAVSRSLWPRFFALCRAISVRPVQVPAPPQLVDLIETLVAAARQMGRRVRDSMYSRADPIIPASMLGLGRETQADEAGDAVQINRRLQAALAQGSTDPTSAPASASSASGSARPQSGGCRQLPPRLAAALRGAPAVAPDTHVATRNPTAATPPPTPHPRPAPAQRKRSRPADDPRPTQARMQTRVISNLTLAAPPSDWAASHTALREAARRCAATRAESFAQAGLASQQGVEQLTRLLQHAADLDDFGAAHGTRAKNDTAWAHWASFAELIGFDPVLTATQVREHTSHVATLLATFLLYVYPKMRGRNDRQWAKPRSAFAYVLAIIRIFRGWKLLLPPAKMIKGELHGLLRSFVNIYGVKALMPSRREPMKFSMLRTMMGIAGARLGARNYTSQSCIGRAFRSILAIGWRTGHRLAEFVYHPGGEAGFYFSRGSVTYIIAGVIVTDPTPAQLAQFGPGDIILLEPPRSKTDQFGEIHCPFPSSLPFSTDAKSAAQCILEIEHARPCRGAARGGTPLIADENGQPYTHSVMDILIHDMLVHCFGGSAAKCYSWHSLRIGLATALKAANVDDSIIQMICRWMNPESLRAYARHGQSLHINCVDQAEKAIVNTMQMANVPKVCNTEGIAAINLTFGGSISARAQAVLDAADDAEANSGVAVAEEDLSPLTASCLGRRVLVPRSIWPSYPCDENHGRGWTARVVNFRPPGVATIKFLHAADARGMPYPDERLLLSALEPV